MPRVKKFDEQEVLEKAMNLFWKRGYHATSIQDLVHHLGINRASLYDTYGGKKQLFEQAFNQYKVVNTNYLRKELFKETNIREGLRKFMVSSISSTLSDSDRKGCFVVNTTTEMLPEDEYMQSILQQNKDTFQTIYVYYLSKGVETGQIAPSKDIQSIASLIYTMQSGLQVILKVEDNKENLIKAVDALLSVLD